MTHGKLVVTSRPLLIAVVIEVWFLLTKMTGS